jgi:DNA polymerase (family 10)
MDNQKIAEIFQEMGDILEIQGANRFRVLAYQKAARVIADLPQDLKDVYQKDPKKLEDIPGIGKDLAF